MKYISIVGVLHRELACTTDGCSDSFWLETNHGFHKVSLTRSQADTAPIERRIVLVVHPLPDEDHFLVADVPEWYQLLDEDLLGRVDYTHKTIALARTVSPGATVSQHQRDSLEETGRQVEAYFRLHSRGRWTVKVRTDFVFTDKVGLQSGAIQEIREHFQEHHPDEDWNYIAGWGGTRVGFCGFGWLNGTSCWIYRNCSLSTILHEIGHNFNLHHSGMDVGQFSEYGGNDSVMSSGTVWHLNAVNMEVLGLLDEGRKIVIDEPQETWLAPIELKAHELWPGEKQLAVIETGTNAGDRKYHFLSTRAPERAYGMSRSQRGLVHVHRPYSTHDWRQTVRLNSIPEGGEAILEDGTLVRNRGMIAGHIRVEVIPGDHPDGPVVPVPEPERPEPIPSVPFGHAVRGLWDSPNSDHQGLDVHFIPGELREDGIDYAVAYWFTHDDRLPIGSSRRDNTRFFVAQGPVIDDVAHLEIFESRNGHWLASGDVERNLVGTGQLWYHSDSEGMFSYQLTDHLARGVLKLDRLTDGNHPLSGGFWCPEIDGTGLSVQYVDGVQVTVYLYTYDSMGNPRWRMGAGEVQETGDIQGTHWAVEKALFRHPDGGKVETMSSFRLDPIDENTYTAEIDGKLFTFERLHW